MALDRHLRQCRGDVENGERFRGLLDPARRGRHLRGELVESLELDAERAVGGARDFGFELAQLRRREADLAGERLAVDEGRVERRRHQPLAVLRGDLDEIAEHVVVANLERAHRRRIGIARLQRGDDAARFVAQRPRLIERGVEAFAHETAVALEVGKLLGQRRVERMRERRVEPAQRARRLRELGGEVGALLQLGR